MSILLTDLKRPDNCTAKPYLSKTDGFASQWLGNVDMHMYVKCDKIHPVVQEL